MIKVYEELRGVKAGDRFGRWTVAGNPFRAGNYIYLAVCRCDCGGVYAVQISNLTTGRTTQCPKCLGKAASEFNQTHGHTAAKNNHMTRLYRIWAAMKTRCSNENQPHYDRYGGKGVAVCGDWLKFEGFRDWAVTAGYADNLTIDRIDSDGNYEPGNCQWITGSENTARRNRDVARKRREKLGA